MSVLDWTYGAEHIPSHGVNARLTKIIKWNILSSYIDYFYCVCGLVPGIILILIVIILILYLTGFGSKGVLV